MAQARTVRVDPTKPSTEAVTAAAEVLGRGGVIALPTDTLYGIACELGRARAIERIHEMRRIDGARRPLTFLLPDLGQLAHYAVVSQTAFRILGRILPGPYCVELAATGNVPQPFVVGERRTIGVRVPDSPLCEQILWAAGKPVLSATAKSRGGALLTTAAEIEAEYGGDLDLILDGGALSGPASTVVSLVDDWVAVLREGKGPADKVLLG